MMVEKTLTRETSLKDICLDAAVENIRGDFAIYCKSNDDNAGKDPEYKSFLMPKGLACIATTFYMDGHNLPGCNIDTIAMYECPYRRTDQD